MFWFSGTTALGQIQLVNFIAILERETTQFSM